MSKQKSAAPSKKSLKKEVAAKLTVVFSDVKEAIGDKKFAKKVKKASKILASGKVKKAFKKADKEAKTPDEIVVASASMS